MEVIEKLEDVLTSDKALPLGPGLIAKVNTKHLRIKANRDNTNEGESQVFLEECSSREILTYVW